MAYKTYYFATKILIFVNQKSAINFLKIREFIFDKIREFLFGEG